MKRESATCSEHEPFGGSAQAFGLSGEGTDTVSEVGRRTKKSLPPVPGQDEMAGFPRRGPCASVDTRTPHAKNELLVVINKSDARLVKEFAFFFGYDKDSVSAIISAVVTVRPVSFERLAASTTARVRRASG